MYAKSLIGNHENLSLAELKNIAIRAKRLLEPGVSFLISGPLGVGKTTFIRFIIKSLCPHIEFIPSPTFSLMYSYETKLGTLWHMDLYRIERFSDLEELGIYEILQENICLIEWPDRLEKIIPPKAFFIELAFEKNPDKRRLTIKT